MAEQNRGESEQKLGSALASEATERASKNAETEQRAQQTKDLQSNRALTNPLAEHGLSISYDAQGNPTITKIPGYEGAPKDLQQEIAQATQTAIAKGVDPMQDPHVQSLVRVAQSLQKPEKLDDKETYVQQYLKENPKGTREGALKAYAAANQAPERDYPGMDASPCRSCLSE